MAIASISSIALIDDEHTHWKYRGEGAMNLVIEYDGEEPSLYGHVLRLQKCAIDGSGRKCSFSSEEITRYAHDVLAPLLPNDIIPSMTLVTVTPIFLQCIAESIYSYRPVTRHDWDIDTSCTTVILMSDSCGANGELTSLTFEVKPKWGFLYDSAFYEGSSEDVRLSYCRFCMHQWLKHAHPEDRSDFCPLNLFSAADGSVEGIQRGMKAIWELIVSPQNNLRVFSNGGRTKIGANPEDVIRACRYFCGVDTEFNERIMYNTLPTSGPVSEIIQQVVTALVSSGALTAIRRIQMFDTVGVHATAAATVKSSSFANDSYSAAAAPVSGVSFPNDVSSESTYGLVSRFLISATMKDCSIMVTLHRNAPANVKLVDLDPKPISKLSKYVQLDDSIVENFIANGGRGKPCCSMVQLPLLASIR